MITHNNQTYKVVVTTPAGRERYLNILKKYVYRDMASGLIDGWQLWQNTMKPEDIAYHESMVLENPKVKIYNIDPPIQNIHNFCDTSRTCEFFKFSHDDDTIYIRLDDDIVWYEEGTLEKMAIARIEYPDAFVIFPNVINNTFLSRGHQEIGALSKEIGMCHGVRSDMFILLEGDFINLVHQTFIERHKEGTFKAFYLPSRVFDKYESFSINSLAYWGKDHIVPSTSEEAWIAWEQPEKLKRPVYFLGNVLLMHYSYFPQRKFLEVDGEEPKYLDYYKQLSEEII